MALLHSRNSTSPQSPTSSVTEASSRLIVRPGMDAKLKLPIDDTPSHDFQRLFTRFFNFHFDTMVLIFRPQLRDPAFKQTVYRLALHNPVYCLSLVAQSHMSDLKNGVAVPDVNGDNLTDTIYTRLLEMTREKVESFDLDDVDVLLMAIVVLSEYDLHLHQYDSLSTHHVGMKALVSKRGGIHNLGLSLPYVLRMDRFLAIRSNQMPQFASPDLATAGPAVHRLEHNGHFGLSFAESSPQLSDHIRFVCSDAAHLLELMDELAMTFNPSRAQQTLSPKMEYFYFLRENIEVRYAILNYQSSRSNAKINVNRLALCASHLVTYYLAQDNYLPLVTDLLATRLWNMLTKPPPSSPGTSASSSPPFERSNGDPSLIPTIDLAGWKDNLPMLLWLLFACALPDSRTSNMTFAGHLSSALLSSPGPPKSQQPSSRPASVSSSRRLPQHHHHHHPSSRSITSPSSTRRHRYLPSFILYVAEHLVGERPLTGTHDWDAGVVRILESHVWAGDRLSVEYQNIIARVHEGVLTRAED